MLSPCISHKTVTGQYCLKHLEVVVSTGEPQQMICSASPSCWPVTCRVMVSAPLFVGVNLRKIHQFLKLVLKIHRVSPKNGSTHFVDFILSLVWSHAVQLLMGLQPMLTCMVCRVQWFLTLNDIYPSLMTCWPELSLISVLDFFWWSFICQIVNITDKNLKATFWIVCHCCVEDGGFRLILSLLCVYNLQAQMQDSTVLQDWRASVEGGKESGSRLPRVKI
jgi:hypothetical protein